MPKFGVQSLTRLESCHPLLQELFHEVIKYFDCTVICGFRGEAEQNEAFRTGASKKKWPTGEHNKFPSMAVDVVPYPVNWNDTNRMRYFAGFVKGIAAMKGIKIRWGGDWDMDTELGDQTFFDFPHFELEEE